MSVESDEGPPVEGISAVGLVLVGSEEPASAIVLAKDATSSRSRPFFDA